jgi:hypothetical protein
MPEPFVIVFGHVPESRDPEAARLDFGDAFLAAVGEEPEVELGWSSGSMQYPNDKDDTPPPHALPA